MLKIAIQAKGRLNEQSLELLSEAGILPQERLDEATRILPGMRSPTVLPLAQEGWCSIHAVIDKAQLWERIERLKAIGAEGILILSLENMIR